MLTTLAVANYRSIRELILPISNLNVVTGANGSGKSNLYRALRLIADTADGSAAETLAQEGGLESVLWAGPEVLSGGMKQGSVPVQGTVRRDRINLKLGFAADTGSYAIDYGIPTPVPGTKFHNDPEIKREALWRGESYHHSRSIVERTANVVRARDSVGKWRVIEQHLSMGDSMFSRIADPERAPELLILREHIRSWRFYDHFRSDRSAPARIPRIGTRTLALANDGADLASAWQTIIEIGDKEGLDAAVNDAFPNTHVETSNQNGRFFLHFHQNGLLRPLDQSELSDGTLRYLLWIAALMTARPPSLMILNEPETSLHPDLLPALGRLITKRSEDTQIWVISHTPCLISTLSTGGANTIVLDKDTSETFVHDQELFNTPLWKWPSR